MTWRRMVNGVRRRASRSFTRLAARLNPKSPSAVSTHFYPQQPSCQIPHVWLLYSRFLGERTEGAFVEIGGFDGVRFSNTWGLAARGWRGWMVEPVPELADRCRRNHEQHPAVHVLQQAVAAPGHGTVRLQVGGPLTTANPGQRDEYLRHEWSRSGLTDQFIDAPACSLDELLERHSVPTGFDVLVVDVEGFEEAVFSGFDISRWQPRMMIVELADAHPTLSGTMRNDAALARRIEEHGYVIVAKDMVNTVFVERHTWAAAYGLSAG